MRFGAILASLLGSFGGRALGGAVGGRTGQMIGSLAGSMLGGSLGSGRGGGLGGLLGGLMKGRGQQQPDHAARLSDVETIPDLDDSHAELLISAMCSAAKSDGTVDEAEMTAITSRMGDLDEAETAMLRRELSGPVDVAALVARVPKGFEQEVYGVSVLAIDQTSGVEAAYLQQLAAGLGLSAEVTGRIHAAVAAD
jgi:uncharacterized membrane protein YebE (DUF533 family)